MGLDPAFTPSALPVLGFAFPVIVLNLWVFSGLYRGFSASSPDSIRS
ncbi:MAG: hypothetical protein HQ527_09570 [Cyanobacteria bacterium]|nr:hypothetical protein [Cyanobacteria bacterium bin.51]